MLVHPYTCMARKKIYRWKQLRRLYEMQPYENAFVPFGANRRTFAEVHKEQKMPIPKIEELLKAHEDLGNICSVLKAGDVQADAMQRLQDDLDKVLDRISPPQQSSGQASDFQGIISALKTLSLEAQSGEAGYTLADKIDSVLAEVEKAASDAAAAAAVAPEPMAAVVTDPAPEVAVAPVEAVKAKEPEPAADTAVKPEPEVKADPAAEPAEPAPAPASVEKASLQETLDSFRVSIIGEVKGVMDDLKKSMVTKAGVVNSVIPAARIQPRPPTQPVKPEADGYHMDHTKDPMLDEYNEYGQLKE